MSKKVVGWECPGCHQITKTKVFCCPTEKIEYWECDGEETHIHLREAEANDCTILCRCGHSLLDHFFYTKGGCRPTIDGFECKCPEFRDAEGGAE